MKAVLLKTNVEGIEKRHFFRENIYVLGYFWFLVLQTLKLNEGPPFFFFFFLPIYGCLLWPERVESRVRVRFD